MAHTDLHGTQTINFVSNALKKMSFPFEQFFVFRKFYEYLRIEIYDLIQYMFKHLVQSFRVKLEYQKT